MSILFKIYITLAVIMWLISIIYACVIGDFDSVESTKFWGIISIIMLILLIIGFVYALYILLITLWGL